MTKLTYGYIKKYFEDNYCELLSEEYINANTKLKYRCKCGNESEIIFNSFRQGGRCKQCGIDRRANKRKFSYNDVKQYFEDNGCELLENDYINSQELMRYKCSCGNISKIRFNEFRQGRRCSKCGGTEKHSYEYVYNYFKENGCELLEKEYINNNTRMKFICKCGNINKITFAHFKRGNRCITCGGKERLTQEYVENYFKERGCEFLDKYKNAKTKYKYRCVCGEISEISVNKFKIGRRCKKCGNKKISEKMKGEKNHQWREDREKYDEDMSIRKLCGNLLHNTLKYTGDEKNKKTSEMLGYSKNELLEHLKHQSLFDKWNIDRKNYHIEHILPVIGFIRHGIKDPKIINHLSNLTIEHWEYNLSKHDHYLEEDFQKYMEKFKDE